MNNFEASLLSALGEQLSGKVYLAAVSGGADSSAMLAGLAELRAEAGFTLHCAHVEHGIRPAEESRGDAGEVEALSEKLKVPCRVISVPPGKIARAAGSGGPGIEGAARIFRLKALHREAERVGAERILTAHTRDDLLETLLMRILRGSGPAGLSAMPRSRGRMLKPLLDLTRQDVLGYLKEKGLSYRTDSTNEDIRFLRNRVRHKLVPLLDEYFPFWRSTLLALAQTQSLCAAYLEAEAGRLLPWEAVGAIQGKCALRLPEADFFNAAAILREEAIFAGADMLAGDKNHAADFCHVPKRAAVRRASHTGAASLGPVRLQKKNGFVEMIPSSRLPGERGFSLLINKPGVYELKVKITEEFFFNCGIRAGAEAAGNLGAFYAHYPVVFRKYRGTDRIRRGNHVLSLSGILDRKVNTGYTVIITAEDAEGPAAFIGTGRDGNLLVIGREDHAAKAAAGALGAGACFVMSLKTGGKDV